MVLQPRKFKFKLKQKKRRINYRFKTQPQNLRFGQLGLILTKPLFINSKKMFRLKLFLKKSARRTDKTSRKVWINTFPHIPLTKKVIGSRMGKGKGKLSIWFNKLSTGVIFIEVKNLRPGRAKYFLKQTQNKLKSSSKIIFSLSSAITLHKPLGKGSISYQTFW